MEKRKEAFTRRECKIDLKGELKHEVNKFFFIYFFYALIFSCVDILIYALGYCTLALLLIIPAAIPLICKMCYVIYRLNMINKCEFSIVEDKVVNIGINENSKDWSLHFAPRFAWSMDPRYENALYFSGYGRYTVARRPHYMWSDLFYGMGSHDLAGVMSSCGDEFYLVVFNKNKQKPVIVYNKRFFDFKEN